MDAPLEGRPAASPTAAERGLCLLAAWAASRVPALRFDAEQTVTPPPVD